MNIIPTSKTETYIYVRLQREGIHRYPNAINLPGVEFLAQHHRHIFHIEARIQVFHDDRELEFILVKRWIESLYGNEGVLDLNNQSCEMIANELISKICEKYGFNRNITVDVSEDGENGAVVTRTVNNN